MIITRKNLAFWLGFFLKLVPLNGRELSDINCTCLFYNQKQHKYITKKFDQIKNKFPYFCYLQ